LKPQRKQKCERSSANEGTNTNSIAIFSSKNIYNTTSIYSSCCCLLCLIRHMEKGKKRLEINKKSHLKCFSQQYQAIAAIARNCYSAWCENFSFVQKVNFYRRILTIESEHAIRVCVRCNFRVIFTMIISIM
jgi:hypothetical protein